jgi:hypothetical protein
LQKKEINRKKLELVVNLENEQKDPENMKPKFKPDLSISQEVVSKSYQGGFQSFLREVNVWKQRKDKKLRDI